jgi:hypothetical protein
MLPNSLPQKHLTAIGVRHNECQRLPFEAWRVFRWLDVSKGLKQSDHSTRCLEQSKLLCFGVSFIVGPLCVKERKGDLRPGQMRGPPLKGR